MTFKILFLLILSTSCASRQFLDDWSAAPPTQCYWAECYQRPVPVGTIR